jgi:hypothetical protein
MHIKNFKILIGGVLMLIAIVAAGGLFWWGSSRALQTLSITSVTPDQLADAMQKDAFYTLYREKTLVVQGTVASVRNEGNGTIITLKTSTSYQTLCNIGSAPTTVKVGDTSTLLAEGATAIREPSAVLLVGCVAL